MTCVYLADLSTGGLFLNTVELFLPSDGTLCTLPALNGLVRYDHTADNHILCGGTGTAKSCTLWNPDSCTWEEWGEELEVEREYHVSWTPSADSSGTYLMGGDRSSSEVSTTLIKPDGTQENGFTLKYDTR